MLLVFAYVAAVALAGIVSRPRPADLAVVFGNAVTADGQPSPRLAARLDTALALYRGGAVRRILVSGGVEQPGHLDEAAIMAGYLEGRGVPTAVIVQDPAGVDTFETARHVAGMVERGGGVVVVTQWFHVPRAMLALRRLGLRDVSGDWPRWFEARDAYSLLREAAALPYYAVRSVPRVLEAPKPPSSWQSPAELLRSLPLLATRPGMAVRPGSPREGA